MSRYSASGACVSGASVRVRSRWSRSRDFLRDLFDGAAGLGGPAPGAHFGSGIQVDLHLRVGEHDGADVAAFHHHRLGRADAPLLFAHGAPHARSQRDFRSGFADARLADGRGHVLAVQEHGGFARRELDARFFGELLQAMQIVEIYADAQGPQRHRPVHRAGVDIRESQPLCDGARDGALARARRPVNRNNPAFLCFGGDTSQYPM